MFKNKSKPTSKIDSLIGEHTQLEGDISFIGGLRVDGKIRGNVTEEGNSDSALVLSESGQIEGMVKVSQLLVNGRIVGPIYASGYVELQAKARVTGDVHYRSLEIHTGAVVDGNLVYQGDAQDIKLLTNKD